MRLLILTFGSMLLAISASAATYYVSTTGSDSNPGTQASPFLTAQKGANTVAAGDTLIFMNGTYKNSSCSGSTGEVMSLVTSGTSANPITIKAQNHLGAILDGNNNACYGVISFHDHSNINWYVIQDLVIQGASWNGIGNVNTTGMNNTIIQNCEIRNIGNRFNNDNSAITGIYTAEGTSNVTIDGNLIHDNGPTSSSTGDPAHDHQLYLHGSNNLVINNILYNGYNGPYVNVGSSDGVAVTVKIYNNVFYGYSISWYYIDGAIYMNTNGGNDGNVPDIENNIFYNIRTLAIAGAQLGTTGCKIKNNIVYDDEGTSGPPALINTAPTGCTPSGNSVGTNPGFIQPPGSDDPIPSTTTYDFHLTSTATAIGFGQDLSAIFTDDFSGATRAAGAYDDGAFYFSTSTPVGTGGPLPGSWTCIRRQGSGASSGGASVTDSVSCDSGEVAVLGGCNWDSSTTSQKVSGAPTGQGFSCRGISLSGTHTITSYVNCCK